MDTKYSNLFKPFTIGKLEIKNRIALAALGGHALDEEAYFVEKAKGGTGLLVSGASMVQNKYDVHIPTEFDDPMEFLQNHGAMLEKVHSYGTKMFKQLTAGTGRCTPPAYQTEQGISASENPNVWNPNVRTREMTIEEIQFYIKSFIKAAVLSKQAGYDGVEIHAVHEGYLLDQFTIGFFNRRDDQYGGSLENRARFAVEILQGIKQACGKDFPVSLRYSVRSYIKGFNSGALPGEEFKEAGRDLKEGLELAQYFEKMGYDMLNCDNGTYDSWYWPHPPMYMPEGLNVDDIAEVKKVVKIPVLAAGRLENPEISEKVLLEGKADAISIGRQLLADPHYTNKIKNGELDEVKPCIACHIGCLGRIFVGKDLSCAINPSCGKERDHILHAPLKIKNVLVIGGGMAGMEAALISAKRGHKVCLYEKSSELGGVFIAAASFDFKEADKKLINWYKRQLIKYNIDIKLNIEVTSAHLEQLKPDVVFVATGAVENKLPIEGSEKTIPAIKFLRGLKETGSKVAIIGGGITGSEIAYSLAKQGKDVSVIEMLPETIPDRIFSAANRNCLKDLMKFHGVKEFVNSSVVKISDDAVTISTNGTEMQIACDTVITAIGYSSNKELYNKIYPYSKEVYLIGDAQKPANILNAIWSANEVARSI